MILFIRHSSHTMSQFTLKKHISQENNDRSTHHFSFPLGNKVEQLYFDMNSIENNNNEVILLEPVGDFPVIFFGSCF